MFSVFSRRNRCLLWLAIAGSFLTVFSLVLALVILPSIIQTSINDHVIIKNGTVAWDRFMEFPFPLDFTVFLMQVKNPEEVQNGGRPYLEEIGPFIYKNYRKKVNVKFLDAEYVSYNTMQTFEYDDERSVLPEDYEALMLNFVALGLYQLLENSRIVFPYSVDDLLPHVLDDTHLFQNITLKKFLFDGTPFCNPKSTSIPSKFICLVVMLLNLRMVQYNDDLTMSYSLLGFKNNNHDGTFVVNTGVKDITKLGQIYSWNGLQYTDFYEGDENNCNKVAGVDVGVLPPHLEPHKSFQMYSTDICRSLPMRYLKKDIFRDINVYKYGLTANTWRPEKNNCPNESCFCSHYTRGLDGEKSCFLDGVQDTYPCLGIPAIISFPHYLYADQKYAESVDNLHPKEELHASWMSIQPDTGAPLSANISLQLNIVCRPFRLSGKMAKITEHLGNFSLPLLWFQQGVTLPGNLFDEVSFAMTILHAVEIGKWVFVTISGLILLYPIAKLLLGTNCDL